MMSYDPLFQYFPTLASLMLEVYQGLEHITELSIGSVRPIAGGTFEEFPSLTLFSEGNISFDAAGWWHLSAINTVGTMEAQIAFGDFAFLSSPTLDVSAMGYKNLWLSGEWVSAHASFVNVLTVNASDAFVDGVGIGTLNITATDWVQIDLGADFLGSTLNVTAPTAIVATGVGDDWISVNAETVAINSGQGDDLVNTSGGNSFVVAGDGDDTIVTDAIWAEIAGGTGDDLLVSDSPLWARHELSGGSGNDDFVITGNGWVQVYGGDGNDNTFLFDTNGPRIVELWSGPGQDTLHVSPSAGAIFWNDPEPHDQLILHGAPGTPFSIQTMPGGAPMLHWGDTLVILPQQLDEPLNIELDWGMIV